MRQLAVLLCLTLAVLLFSAGEGFALPPCQGDGESKWQNCEGILTSGTGMKYVRVFKEGRFEGEKAEHGIRYDGENKNGPWHGQGSETSTDGSVKEGIFKDGEFQYEEKGSSTVLAQGSCDYNLMTKGAEGMLAFYACMAKLGPGEQKRVFQQEQERVAREGKR